MKSRQVALPIIGLIAGTRVVLGIGIGLLMASRLTREMRRTLGLRLVALGAVTTIPLIASVLHGGRGGEFAHDEAGVGW
jgi:hypothetical protein